MAAKRRPKSSKPKPTSTFDPSKFNAAMEKANVGELKLWQAMAAAGIGKTDLIIWNQRDKARAKPHMARYAYAGGVVTVAMVLRELARKTVSLDERAALEFAASVVDHDVNELENGEVPDDS